MFSLFAPASRSGGRERYGRRRAALQGGGAGTMGGVARPRVGTCELLHRAKGAGELARSGGQNGKTGGTRREPPGLVTCPAARRMGRAHRQNARSAAKNPPWRGFLRPTFAGADCRARPRRCAVGGRLERESTMGSNDHDWVSISELARRRGVTRQAIHIQVRRHELELRRPPRGSGRLVNVNEYQRATGFIVPARDEIAGADRRRARGNGRPARSRDLLREAFGLVRAALRAAVANLRRRFTRARRRPLDDKPQLPGFARDSS
jgi:hypothetical protein